MRVYSLVCICWEVPISDLTMAGVWRKLTDVIGARRIGWVFVSWQSVLMGRSFSVSVRVG